MIQKNRVRVDGKIVAYEWVDNDDRWHNCDADMPNAMFPGAYPHPGKREQFTGKEDKNGVPIFDQSKLNDGRIIRTVYWSEGSLTWRVTGQIASDWLMSFSSDRLEVIPEAQSDEQRSSE